MLLLVAFAAAASGAYAASSFWSRPIALDSSDALGLLGYASVACPSIRQCTAVDAIGREVTFNPRSPGHRVPDTIDSEGAPDAPASTR